jgi:hypothetical protein
MVGPEIQILKLCNTRSTPFPFLPNEIYCLRLNTHVGYTRFAQLMEEKTLTKRNSLMIKGFVLVAFCGIFGYREIRAAPFLYRENETNRTGSINRYS